MVVAVKLVLIRLSVAHVPMPPGVTRPVCEILLQRSELGVSVVQSPVRC